MKLFVTIIMRFYVTDQILITHSALARYVRNKME